MNSKTKKTTIKTNIVSSTMTRARQHEMYELYTQFYKVSPDAFYARFDSNDCYALYSCGEKLVGFTGFRIKEVKTASGTYQTMYIGQTVMEEAYRGHSMLARSSCKLLWKLFLKNPFRPVHVWCDALTYKPYLIFANSVKRYYPSRLQAMTPKIKGLLDHLGAHYYGDLYNAATGTVSKPVNIITDPSTFISDRDRSNPDIDFYAKANPGHAKGHGLLLITPIDFSNFCFLIKKCLKKKWKTVGAESRTARRQAQTSFA